MLVVLGRVKARSSRGSPTPQPVVIMHTATLSNCRNILSCARYRQSGETSVGTAGKLVGMVIIRVIGTIGSQVLRALAGLWMQFRD